MSKARSTGLLRKFIKQIEAHPTISLIVFSLVTLGAGAVFSPLERKDVLQAIWAVISVLGDNVTIPRWVYVIFLLCLIFTSMYLGYPIINWIKKCGHRKPLAHLSYTEDKINNARWRWIWLDDKMAVYEIRCFCPKCDYELGKDCVGNGSNKRLICPKCEMECSERFDKLNKLKEEIINEVERRARTKYSPASQSV